MVDQMFQAVAVEQEVQGLLVELQVAQETLEHQE
tara:strand:+ start:357 stop:458 length:102 start_codon:yes stop_codon:yes gene_type:complete